MFSRGHIKHHVQQGDPGEKGLQGFQLIPQARFINPTQLTNQADQGMLCVICCKNNNILKPLFCISCHQYFHGSCLEPPVQVTPLVQTNWQCAECKKCEACGRDDDADKMLFCDRCDKGFHTFCLDPVITIIPEDSWQCKRCLSGTSDPPISLKGSWKKMMMETHTIENGLKRKLFNRSSHNDYNGTSENTKKVKTALGNPAVHQERTEPAVFEERTNPPVCPERTDPAVDPERTDPPVYSGRTDPAVFPGSTDPAVDSGRTDPAVDSGRTDPAVDSGRTDPAVFPASTDPAVFPHRTDPAVSEERIYPNTNQETTDDTSSKLMINPGTMGHGINVLKGEVYRYFCPKIDHWLLNEETKFTSQLNEAKQRQSAVHSELNSAHQLLGEAQEKLTDAQKQLVECQRQLTVAEQQQVDAELNVSGTQDHSNVVDTEVAQLEKNLVKTQKMLCYHKQIAMLEVHDAETKMKSSHLVSNSADNNHCSDTSSLSHCHGSTEQNVTSNRGDQQIKMGNFTQTSSPILIKPAQYLSSCSQHDQPAKNLMSTSSSSPQLKTGSSHCQLTSPKPAFIPPIVPKSEPPSPQSHPVSPSYEPTLPHFTPPASQPEQASPKSEPASIQFGPIFQPISFKHSPCSNNDPNSPEHIPGSPIYSPVY